VLAIIQARMTSTRLPGKVLANLAGVPLLSYMVARLRRAVLIDRLVVATTRNAADDPVADLCRHEEIDVFRGDEHDVLDRFNNCALEFGGDIIVRLTADCPMIDAALVDEIVKAFGRADVDYLSNSVTRTYPDGLDVEVFSHAALERAALEATAADDREHVTSYIHGFAEDGAHGFRARQYTFAGDFGHLRWTVDTQEDLDRVRALTQRLPVGYSWLEALAEATKAPALLGSVLPESDMVAVGAGGVPA
jgi:spore coat polysaccharide biosynthesis protein SpsF